MSTLSTEEVLILIHENALEEMELLEARMARRIHAQIEELDTLRNEVRQKRFQIHAAREALLRRTV